MLGHGSLLVEMHSGGGSSCTIGNVFVVESFQVHVDSVLDYICLFLIILFSLGLNFHISHDKYTVKHISLITKCWVTLVYFTQQVLY